MPKALARAVPDPAPRATTTARPNPLPRAVMVSLLALPLALIGTGMAYRAVSVVISAKSMQAWPTVPATLQTVQLTGHVKATYTYAVNGQQFTGKRASLYGDDNLSNFHQRAYEQLQGYLSRQEPWPAHVNPKAPDESILTPELRWDVVAFYLIFVAIFGGAGWGLLIGSWSKYRRYRQELALQKQFPSEPWRWRVEWSTNHIKSTETATALGAVCITVFWNACSWPMLFALPEKLHEHRYSGLLLLVFPLIGVGLVGWTAVQVARARRFGRTYLELDDFPARPGENVTGRIYAPAALGNAEEVGLTFTCEQNSRRGSGVKVSAMWETAAIAEIVRGESPNGGVVLKFQMLIPDSLPDSTRNWGEWYEWHLAASAGLKGADFEAEFEVPVFKR
jgi:hypothetical protein